MRSSSRLKESQSREFFSIFKSPRARKAAKQKITLNTRDEGQKNENNINENNLKHQGRGAESERGHRAWLQVHHVEAGEPG